jgi:transcriptional regulator GlxA family with amidase domain
LKGEEGARLRGIATLGDQSQRTAKAIAWIRKTFEQPLRVDDLAKVAGMGVSTLHHHFQELTAMSPLRYEKQLRLQSARSRMLMTPQPLLLKWIRKCKPIQWGIQPLLRSAAAAGYSGAASGERQ